MVSARFFPIPGRGRSSFAVADVHRTRAVADRGDLAGQPALGLCIEVAREPAEGRLADALHLVEPAHTVDGAVSVAVREDLLRGLLPDALDLDEVGLPGLVDLDALRRLGRGDARNQEPGQHDRPETVALHRPPSLRWR